jgi:hypothetical protein
MDARKPTTTRDRSANTSRQSPDPKQSTQSRQNLAQFESNLRPGKQVSSRRPMQLVQTRMT